MIRSRDVVPALRALTEADEVAAVVLHVRSGQSAAVGGLITNDSGTSAGADQILDFLSGTDKLDFRVLDANPNIAGRQALTYVGTGAFSATGVARRKASL